MTMTIGSFTLLIATMCAALMGFAIQRGATCAVAAVGEIVRVRKARQLIAMGEAALWVAGGLLIAQAIGIEFQAPEAYATTGWTIAGAVLLGLGAWINRACVFGAIAKLGSGNWVYALTPLGYFVGDLTLSTLFPGVMPIKLQTALPVPTWLAIPFVIFAIYRLSRMARHRRHMKIVTAGSWSPHHATIVIGVTLVIMFIGVGDWTYTNVLMRLARGMHDEILWRLFLFIALLSGAIFGGWSTRRLSSRRPALTDSARCLSGGMMMGWGSALTPGGNDGLILIGMPLLMPYAWVAVIVMMMTIWSAMQADGLASRLRRST